MHFHNKKSNARLQVDVKKDKQGFFCDIPEVNCNFIEIKDRSLSFLSIISGYNSSNINLKTVEKLMKSSVSKKKQSAKKLHRSKLDSPQHTFAPYQKRPFAQDDFRRYNEFETKQILPSPKRQSRQSRATQIRSQHPANRNRSITPPSRMSQTYMTECQVRYKQLQQILKQQNQNYYKQNQFLKQEIRKLYQRQTKHKQLVRRYKEKIEFLQVENRIYQQRYQEIKEYVNTVVDKMAMISQMTEKNQEMEDRQLLRSSSLDLVNRLREELGHYEEWKQEDEMRKKNSNVNQENMEDSEVFIDMLHGSPQNVNNSITQQPQFGQNADLQQTRFIKDPKQQFFRTDGFALKKPPKPTPPSKSKQSDQLFNSTPPQSNEQSNPSNPNSDSKTIDAYFKPINFLQDTSESNCLNVVNQQIQELTDQSEALMYELKQKGNHDAEIKKKIIRISQKIRQLKMETQNNELHRFTSLQNIAKIH